MSGPRPFAVGGRQVGPGKPCFIIAEAGVNHNGDVALAEELVKRAAKLGADCVKFQTFRPEEVASAAAPKADYQLRNTDPAESQLEMLKKLALPKSAYPRLMKLCAKEGVAFLSTPYGLADIDFLDALGVPAFKIASGQLVEPRFLARAAAKGKPLIVSTGMGTLAEVEAAVKTIRRAGGTDFALLQCTTNYPADVADANLRAMVTLRETFGRPAGYSDHTLGATACLAAVALGACVIEKHFTLDKNLPGPDHRCSADPGELAALIRGVREVEAALGRAEKAPTAVETANARGVRRSLVAARAIRAGEKITEKALAVKRPGTGIAPADWDKVLGRRAKAAIARDAVLSWDLLDA